MSTSNISTKSKGTVKPPSPSYSKRYDDIEDEIPLLTQDKARLPTTQSNNNSNSNSQKEVKVLTDLMTQEQIDQVVQLDEFKNPLTISWRKEQKFCLTVTHCYNYADTIISRANSSVDNTTPSRSMPNMSTAELSHRLATCHEYVSPSEEGKINKLRKWMSKKGYSVDLSVQGEFLTDYCPPENNVILTQIYTMLTAHKNIYLDVNFVKKFDKIHNGLRTETLKQISDVVAYHLLQRLKPELFSEEIQSEVKKEQEGYIDFLFADEEELRVAKYKKT